MDKIKFAKHMALTALKKLNPIAFGKSINNEKSLFINGDNNIYLRYKRKRKSKKPRTSEINRSREISRNKTNSQIENEEQLIYFKNKSFKMAQKIKVDLQIQNYVSQ